MVFESTLTRNMYMKLLVQLLVRRWGFYFAIAMFLAILAWAQATSASIIPAVAYLAFVTLLYSLSILRAGFSKKNQHVFLKRQFSFKDKNILLKTPVSKNTMPWEALIKWSKIAGSYLLYFSSSRFIAIPQADIPAGEIDAFESLLRGKIGAVK